VTVDPIAQFKQVQRESWASFAPQEVLSAGSAARLVAFAGIEPGQRVLDVACGTGVVAVTAARLGAKATGLDLTPELLARARENSQIAQVDIDWHEGDAEELPFADGRFDVVLSQFGHMFAPRPEVAVAEMLRVLRPGGTIAFTTWPPELAMGRMFALVSRYLPPPPPGVSPPARWGDPNVIRERLGGAVRDIVFERGTQPVPALSPQHQRIQLEHTSGPVIRLVQMLEGTDDRKLEAFRREYESLIADYFDGNVVRRDFLMTRAVKN